MSYQEVLRLSMNLSKSDLRRLMAELQEFVKVEEQILFDIEDDADQFVNQFISFPVMLEPVINVIPDQPSRAYKKHTHPAIRIVKNKRKYILNRIFQPMDIVYDKRTPEISYLYNPTDQTFVRNDGSGCKLNTLSRVCRNENIRTNVRVIRNNKIHILVD
jgi:hypothetical protein